MKYSALALAFCLVLGGLPATVFGQSTVLTLETAFEGDVSDAVKERFRDALHQALSENTPNAVLTEEETSFLLGDNADRLYECNLEASCLADVGESTGAAAAVGCVVSVAGEIYLFSIDVFDLSNGDGIYYSDTDCPLCTVDEAEDTLAGLGASAGSSIPITAVEVTYEPPDTTPAVETITLFIRAQPEDALVTVDGEAVGMGVIDYPVEPGTHQLVIEAPGYETASEEITVAAGDEDVVVNVSLRESVATTTVRDGGVLDDVDTTLAGSILVGTGVVALISGIVLLAIDGDTTCSSGSVDQCPEVYETTAGGTILTILGTAALTSGTGLLLWDWLAGSPSRVEETPAANLGFSFGSDSALLRVNGRF